MKILRRFPGVLGLAGILWSVAMVQSAQPQTSSKSTPELIKDISLCEGDLTLARNALKVGVNTRQLRIVAAGLSANHYDIRVESLDGLKTFPPDQQQLALVTALLNQSNWKRVFGGEENGGRLEYCQRVTEMVKNLGVDMRQEQLDVAASRQEIADKLSALIVR